MPRIAIIGAGAWGTALAAHAARCGHDVALWAREPEVVEDVNALHENRSFLAGVALPEAVRATGSLDDALRDAGIVIFVPPSQHLRSVAKAAAPFVPRSAHVVVASKGIEETSLMLMTTVLAETLTSHGEDDLCALSGPSFAKEVAEGLPTDVVVASKNPACAQAVADALHAHRFRVYTSKDPVGVEVGGALKNVLAVAAGTCDGLGLGHNARAALVTRGISEMARFGVAMGGDPLTFLGLSGVGDLILTSTGSLSRNRALGMRIAEGALPADYVASQKTVAEGYYTARSAWQLAQRLGIDAPITEQVHAVLHEGRPLLDALRLLMSRSQKEELSGLKP